MPTLSRNRRLIVCCWLLLFPALVRGDEPLPLFAKSNLVAWCIVPFDAAARGPAARAEMIPRLGLSRVAYDWRDEHVGSFEEEIVQYQRHGIEFFAFWDWHPNFVPLVRKYAIHPQFWITNPSPEGATQAERVERAAAPLVARVRQTRELGCQLGLYNHGGWGGEPDNLIAVCRWLREHEQADHVGIVYNLHHGHEHIHDFAEVLSRLKPYLLCLNLNGMNDNAQPKILPLGEGQHDARLLRVIADSGYRGPLGILDHRPETDAEQSLRQNLEGLARLVEQAGLSNP
jgi:sugar phosphate isomerase/epimerase